MEHWVRKLKYANTVSSRVCSQFSTALFGRCVVTIPAFLRVIANFILALCSQLRLECPLTATARKGPPWQFVIYTAKASFIQLCMQEQPLIIYEWLLYEDCKGSSDSFTEWRFNNSLKRLFTFAALLFETRVKGVSARRSEGGTRFLWKIHSPTQAFVVSF